MLSNLSNPRPADDPVVGVDAPGQHLPADVPTVVGLSNMKEVHDVVRIWHEVNKPSQQQGTYCLVVSKVFYRTTGFPLNTR